VNRLAGANKVELLDECNYIVIKMYIYKTKVVHIQKDTVEEMEQTDDVQTDIRYATPA
jgi:hypothetical protein